MVAAYKREIPDRVPISPEIWSATVLEYKQEEFHKYLGPFAEKDFVEAWLDTQRYFGCDPWILVDLDEPLEGENFKVSRKSYFLQSDLIQTEIEINTSKGKLNSIKRTNKEYDGWNFEHPVKIFEKDMPPYVAYTLSDPYLSDVSTISRVIGMVGENGLVSANLGELFVSYLAYSREGDIGQTLIDLFDHEMYLESLHKEYIDYMCRKVDRLSKVAGLDSIFINCGYSDGGVLGPSIYNKWEIPLLAAIAEKAKQYGFVFHLHQHGKCKKILNMIADAGVSLVDSLERPSANGDIDNLAEVKKEIGGQIALKGNIDPINVLKNGTLADIRRQALECIEAAAGNGGFILGTGDSVVEGTPFENIFALVETGLQYGSYNNRQF